ncbi:MAG: acetyl-CoA C-acyltransferase [Ignavibacteriales bacterium CG_4_9_14_3_um_filter_30_11]|nr:MAG: acetyl-CoA C-acyltransferase [Ignavibacteriales bacterium CG_4_9_14_3_um_filter_30_11]
MNNAYIIDAVRTPIGKYGGVLSSVRPDDLAALVIKELLNRNKDIDVNLIEDVILGCTNQAGEDNRNVARMASLIAGLPVEVGGVTVNRLCASGMQAVMDAARAIMLGDGDVFTAGGVESMSRAPFVFSKSKSPFDRNTELYDSTIAWRFTNNKLAEKYFPYSMGETAENLADKYKISREEQDLFAFNSQQKYKSAFEGGKFKDEIIPVPIPQRKKDDLIINKDEHPRPDLTLEKLSLLKPAFKKDGSVTAGNSSGINDGASALLIVSENTVKKFNLKPIAKIVSMAIAGVDPAFMGVGPIPATKKALKRAGLKINDINLIELNEAFAVQSIVCIKELNLDNKIVNVNGGAIALGHPLGCTGARITTTLLQEMKRTKNLKYGLATLCIGVGQGAAIILEKV